MNYQSPRTKRAFLTVSVIASVVSIKMAFLHAPQFLYSLLITVPGVLFMMRRRQSL